MGGPWLDYGGPAQPASHTEEDGPWSDYNGPEYLKPRSHMLGALKGVMPALDNVSRMSPMMAIPGWKEGNERGLKALHGQIEKREQSARPNMFSQAVTGLEVSAPAMLATKNPFLQGAGQGALLSEAQDIGGKARDAAAGAVTNWFGGKIVDKVADTISPLLSPATKRLQAAGVELTPGQTRGGKAMAKEDKMTSRPVVGDAIVAGRQNAAGTWNVATVNEALKPLGAKVPSPIKPGHEAVDWAHTTVGREYDLIVPNLKVSLDGKAFAANLQQSAANLEPAQKKQFLQILNNTLKNGQLTGQALKDAQGELRRLSSTYGSDAAAPNRELGRVLREADDELTDAMMAQNPDWAPRLQKANEAYRGLKIVEDAASRGDDGIMTTAQLRQAVRRGDRSRGKSQTARGKSFLQEWSDDSRAVLPSRTPDSGTAGRQQAGNLFANAKGALDLSAYQGSALLDGLRAGAPAPLQKGVDLLAGGVRAVKPVVRPATVVVTQDQVRKRR